MTIITDAVQGVYSLLFGVNPIVGLFNEDEEELISSRSPVTINESLTSKYLMHPREDGTSIIDHRVIVPMTISMDYVFTQRSYQDDWNRVVSAFYNAEKLLVRTKTLLHDNMYIRSLPTKNSNRVFNGVMVTINLIQTLIVKPNEEGFTTNDVANPTDSDTIDRGTQTPDYVIAYDNVTNALNGIL